MGNLPHERGTPVTGTRGLPCVVFALRRESLYFRREYPLGERLAGAPCPAWRAGALGREVLVLETGPGAEATRAGLGWALEVAPPSLVVSAGFCGALAPHLSPGDVVLATEVGDFGGRCWPCEAAPEVPGVRGRLLSAGSVVCGPAEKQKLGAEWRAVAVDLESASAAGLCQERGLRFACVRAVSDDCHTSLSGELAGVLASGRVAPVAALVGLRQ